MQQCLDMLSNSAIATFSDSSMLWRVMNIQLLNGDEYWSRLWAEQAGSSLTLRWPNDPGEPMAKSRQSRSLSAERNENYSSSIQISPGDANGRSTGRGNLILKGGLQNNYNRKYQTHGVSAPTVRGSWLHVTRAGSLFGSISGDNNSSAITGELVLRHWYQLRSSG